MAYKFNFDLSRLSKSFFEDVVKFAERKKVHKKVGNISRCLVEKFKVHKITGLPVSDALTVVEDLVDVYVNSLSQREAFVKTKKRALFLPHCSRKFMDSRCKAKFDPEMSSYHCAHCSPDCLINKATKLGEEKGYDVYILPGGSCVRKIINQNKYGGIVGVACCEELKLGQSILSSVNINHQIVPLIKNGCSNTRFSLESLEKVL